MKTTNILKLIASLAIGAALAQPTMAADVIRADTVDTMDLGTAWVGGVPPTDADVAVFDSTLSVNLASSLGVDTNYAGLRIANPAGDIAISGSLLGLGASGIDMSASTVNLGLGTGINLNGAQTWNLAAGRTNTINGAIAGTGPLTIAGGGTVNFASGLVTHGGQVVVDGALLNLNTTVSYLSIVTNGATLRNNGHLRLNAGSLFMGGSNSIPTGHSGTVSSVNAANGYNALFYGDSTTLLNVCAPGALVQVSMGVTSSQMNNFHGTVRIAEGGSLRFSATSGGNFGGTNTTFDVLGGLTTRNGLAVNMAQLTGTGNCTGPSGANGTAIWNIGTGNKNLDSSFSGVMQNANASRILAINKVGITKLTLSGNNTYSGATTINGGEFVGVTTGSCSNSAFTVNGFTNGVQVLATGQKWTCNALTYSVATNTLKMDFGATLPSASVAPLFINGALTRNTNVNLRVIGANLPVGTYPLVRYGSLAGVADFTLLPIAGVTASLATNGVNQTIDLVISASADPLSWNTGSGTWDIGSTANWTDANSVVTTYTESAGLGEPVVFADALSGSSPITVTLNSTVVPSGITVSGSKSWTISGTGAINGGTALTKSGSGSLTLATANGFTGALGINGGVISFSALNNLGATTAPISFAGGILQYAGANTADISGHTVTIAAGGATIDTAANVVTYANRIGNGGSGGLTKAGSGPLTLSGVNNYTGSTTISQGTLGLAANAGISNSPVITVSSGATLDASASGLTLNGVISQSLTGPGTVLGTVTTTPGTAILPGTSPGTLTVGGLTLGGGTHTFDIDPVPANRDQIVVNGNLAVNSGTIALNITSTLTNGTYPLITYSGALSGAAANLLLTGSQAGKVLVLSDATPGVISLVVQTAGGSSIEWAGVGGDWDLELSFNWLNGVISTQYINGDFVRFDDDGLAQSTVNLVAAHLPGGVVVSNTVGDYTFSTTGSGRMSGTTRLTKEGASTLNILTDNNNTGPTVISAGAVVVGNGSTVGALGSGNVTNNASLTINRSDDVVVAGIVTGTGALTHQGGAKVTLANNNDYTGATTISSGTLQVGTGGAAGTLSGSASVVNNGNLVLNSSATWTLAGSISGTGNVQKDGSGVVTLSGVNTHTGNTTNNAGTLKLANAAAIPSGVGSGNLVVGGGVVDINGNNVSFGGLLGAGGSLANNTGTATNTVTIGSNDQSTAFAGTILNNTGSGGAIQLVKVGTGELNLSGLVGHTYSGGTIVQAGGFAFNTGGAGSGTISLSNGTSLRMSPNGDSVFPGNTAFVEAGGTVTMNSANLANQYSGPIVSGDANSTLLMGGPISFGAGTTFRSLENFTGTVNVQAGFQLRLVNSVLQGGVNTTFIVDGTLNTRNQSGVGGVDLGALTGSGILSGSSATPFGAVRYIIGGKNQSATFSGTIAGVTPSTIHIVKVGSGTQTLDGTLTYDGATTVSNGVLTIAGAANLDNSPTITVHSGATLDVSAAGLTLGNLVPQSLAGSGTVLGSVTAPGTAVVTVAPGLSVGTLTINGSLTLAANSVVNMELNRSNLGSNADRIAATSVVPNGATLNVTNIGPTLITNSTFQLFTGAVSGFGVVNLPATDVTGQIAYTWQNNLAVDGSIKLLTGMSEAPTPITSVVNGGNLQLTWPVDHTGWTLQVQTNSLSVGVAANWFNVAGSTLTNQLFMPIVPANPTVFYRLTLPLP